VLKRVPARVILLPASFCRVVCATCSGRAADALPRPPPALLPPAFTQAARKNDGRYSRLEVMALSDDSVRKLCKECLNFQMPAAANPSDRPSVQVHRGSWIASAEDCAPNSTSRSRTLQRARESLSHFLSPFLSLSRALLSLSLCLILSLAFSISLARIFCLCV